MSYRIYLIQYIPSRVRLESYNVGVILENQDRHIKRLLSDEQWLERFGEEGSIHPNPKCFNNWKAWCDFFDRPKDSARDYVTSPKNTYTVVQADLTLEGTGSLEKDLEIEFIRRVL